MKSVLEDILRAMYFTPLAYDSIVKITSFLLRNNFKEKECITFLKNSIIKKKERKKKRVPLWWLGAIKIKLH